MVKLNGTTDLTINMVDDIGRLDEVVVTGLSTTIKKKKPGQRSFNHQCNPTQWRRTFANF